MNHKENTLIGRGVLNLPLVIMLPFGLLGFGPGQLFNKIIGCLINLIFFFNYCLILAVTVARFFNVNNYKSTIPKFYTSFAVFMSIKFTILIFIYFKKFNFVHLLEDITKMRKHSLSKIELIFVTVPFIAIVTMTTYLIFLLSDNYVLPVLRTGIRRYVFAFEHSGPTEARIIRILEFLIFLNITWISIFATGYIINVISVVLRREFHKCIEILKEQIEETRFLSVGVFSEAVERFQELRDMMDKVDDMFFLDFTLNLFASLGMLCSAIYGIFVGHVTLDDMNLQILFSMATLLITLPPSAALHSKVTTTFNIAFFVVHFVVKFYNFNKNLKQCYFLGSQYCSSSTKL